MFKKDKTMKKTYINPTIYVRKVVANNILAGSPEMVTSGNASNTTPDTGGGGNGLAKWGDCWSYELDED